MEREIEVGARRNSGRGNVMARRKLHPTVKRATSTAAAGEQDAAAAKISTEKWEALITVWWDHPPAGEE